MSLPSAVKATKPATRKEPNHNDHGHDPKPRIKPTKASEKRDT